MHRQIRMIKIPQWFCVKVQSVAIKIIVKSKCRGISSNLLVRDPLEHLIDCNVH